MKMHLKLFQLHDNNICRVEARSFSNSESLRELTLSRNRLTRLPQDSLGELKFRIGRLDMEGGNDDEKESDNFPPFKL